MRHATLRITISLFAMTIFAANAARADHIDFSWQTSFSPSVFPIQSFGESSLNLMSLSGTGDNVGNAQYLLGASNGSFLEPLGGTNQPFTMSLKLTDGPSGLSDVMTFHGTVTAYPYLGLSGAHAGGVFYSFSDGIGSIVIGQDTYHIQLSDGSLAWGRPDPTPDIAAKINVTTAATAPEPSSLLLAAMALPMLGFARWKKRAAPTSKS